MVDKMLGGLFGGPDQDRMRSQAKDFVSRYEQGPPEHGYEAPEVQDHFKTVGRHMSPEDVQEAAREAFRRMSPEQRRAYKHAMRERGMGQFQAIPDDNDDPEILAEQTQKFMKEEAEKKGGFDGSVGSLFGEASKGESMLDNPAVKAAFAGMAAFAFKKFLDSQQG